MVDFWDRAIMYDKMGYLSGMKESYIIPDTIPGLQLPGGCPAYSATWHARVCPNTCMRTALISYDEPGNFKPRMKLKGPFTTLKVCLSLTSLAKYWAFRRFRRLVWRRTTGS